MKRSAQDEKSKRVLDLAIERHEIDADWFQSAYTNADIAGFTPFAYGRKQLMDELDSVLKTLPSGARVLDIGSGTGHFTDYLAKKGFAAEGVEPSENMLTHARANFPELPFRSGIASATGLESGAYDLIVGLEVLRYLDPKENIESYREFYRILKPGGKVFVTHVNLWATDFYFFFFYAKGLVYKILGKPYHYCNFTTAKQQERITAQVGFPDTVSVGRLCATVRLAYKVGAGFAKWYAGVLEPVFKQQRFQRFPFRNTAGHLVVVCTKPNSTSHE